MLDIIIIIIIMYSVGSGLGQTYDEVRVKVVLTLLTSEDQLDSPGVLPVQSVHCLLYRFYKPCDTYFAQLLYLLLYFLSKI